MANAVEKLNAIAITSIEALNGITDANLEDLNGLEFAGYDPGTTFSTSSATLATSVSRGAGFGATRSAIVVCGGLDASSGKEDTTETYDGSSVGTANSLGTARFALVGTGIESAGLILGGTID